MKLIKRYKNISTRHGKKRILVYSFIRNVKKNQKIPSTRKNKQKTNIEYKVTINRTKTYKKFLFKKTITNWFITIEKKKKIIRRKFNVKFRAKRWKIRRLLRKKRDLKLKKRLQWHEYLKWKEHLRKKVYWKAKKLVKAALTLLPNKKLCLLKHKQYNNIMVRKTKKLKIHRKWKRKIYKRLRKVMRRQMKDVKKNKKGIIYRRNKKYFSFSTIFRLERRSIHTSKIRNPVYHGKTKNSRSNYKNPNRKNKHKGKKRKNKRWRKKIYVKKRKLYYLSQNFKNYRISRHIDNTLYYKNRKIVLLNTKWLSTQLLQNTYEKNININNKYYQKITNLLTYIEKKKKLITNLKNTLLSNKFRKNKEQFCLKKTLQYRLCKKLYQKKYRNHKRKTWNGVIKNSFYWKRLRKRYVYLNNGVNFRKRREKTNFISLNPRFWINKYRFGHGITKCGKKKFKRRGYIGSYHSYPWLNPILYKKRLYRFSKENVYLRLKRPNLHKRNKIYFNYTRILFNKWNPSIKKQRYFYLKTILSKIILAVYGHLRLKQFKKLVKSNNRIKPKHNTRLSYLLSRFERRLDVLVYRMNIAPTIQWSRELIRLGMITVDSVVTQKPHYLVNNFSLVQYVCNKKHKNRLEYFFNKKLLKKTVPSFLLYNSRLNAGLLLHSPKENMLLNNDRTKIKLLNILRLSN